MSKQELINNVKENAKQAKIQLAGITQYNKNQLEELARRLEEIINTQNDIQSFLNRVSMENLLCWSMFPDKVTGTDRINHQFYLAQSKSLRILEDSLYKNL